MPLNVLTQDNVQAFDPRRRRSILDVQAGGTPDLIGSQTDQGGDLRSDYLQAPGAASTSPRDGLAPAPAPALAGDPLTSYNLEQGPDGNIDDLIPEGSYQHPYEEGYVPPTPPPANPPPEGDPDGDIDELVPPGPYGGGTPPPGTVTPPTPPAPPAPPPEPDPAPEPEAPPGETPPDGNIQIPGLSALADLLVARLNQPNPYGDSEVARIRGEGAASLEARRQDGIEGVRADANRRGVFYGTPLSSGMGRVETDMAREAATFENDLIERIVNSRENRSNSTIQHALSFLGLAQDETQARNQLAIAAASLAQASGIDPNSALAFLMQMDGSSGAGMNSDAWALLGNLFQGEGT